MKVAEASEAQILHRLMQVLSEHHRQTQNAWEKNFSDPYPLLVGPGDDAAVLVYSGKTVSTIDTLTQNQDFRLVWPSGEQTSALDLGHKAVAQNLADVASMGATPVNLLVSLTLPAQTQVQWVEDFAQGLVEALYEHQVPWVTIAGGDLGQGAELSVTVSAHGVVENPVLRSGAQPGDFLMVAGDVGSAAAGLALLESPVYRSQQDPQLDRLSMMQKRPRASLHAGMKADFAHAMLDVSDGIVKDAGRLAQASCLSIDIQGHHLETAYQQLLPAAHFLCTTDPSYTGQKAEELVLTWCLTGGENHGMLACISPADQNRARQLGFQRIGVCKQDAVPAVTLDGKKYQGKGWDHFERNA